MKKADWKIFFAMTKIRTLKSVTRVKCFYPLDHSAPAQSGTGINYLYRPTGDSFVMHQKNRERLLHLAFKGTCKKMAIVNKTMILDHLLPVLVL